MAGHSKFKNIMHRKGRADSARSKLFSKLSREITLATQINNGDAGMNPRLRMVLLKCRAANMPSETVSLAGTEAEQRGQSFMVGNERTIGNCSQARSWRWSFL